MNRNPSELVGNLPIEGTDQWYRVGVERVKGRPVITVRVTDTVSYDDVPTGRRVLTAPASTAYGLAELVSVAAEWADDEEEAEAEEEDVSRG